MYCREEFDHLKGIEDDAVGGEDVNEADAMIVAAAVAAANNTNAGNQEII